MGTVEDGWRAVFAMTELFSAVAPGVAEKLGYGVRKKSACPRQKNINFIKVL